MGIIYKEVKMNKLLKAKCLLFKIAGKCVEARKTNTQKYNQLCKRREQVRSILISIWQ